MTLKYLPNIWTITKLQIKIIIRYEGSVNFTVGIIVMEYNLPEC